MTKGSPARRCRSCGKRLYPNRSSKGPGCGKRIDGLGPSSTLKCWPRALQANGADCRVELCISHMINVSTPSAEHTANIRLARRLRALEANDWRTRTKQSSRVDIGRD